MGYCSRVVSRHRMGGSQAWCLFDWATHGDADDDDEVDDRCLALTSNSSNTSIRDVWGASTVLGEIYYIGLHGSTVYPIAA